VGIATGLVVVGDLIGSGGAQEQVIVGETVNLAARLQMSMARLWRDQGKRDEARELLAPVYGWFTEGFDTRDLKEAKALLEELTS
jgi:predicted ATPase